jgi:hypothetical protein
MTDVQPSPEEAPDASSPPMSAGLPKDDDFDRKIAATVDQLDWLIEEGTKDFRAGRTEEIDPDHL